MHEELKKILADKQAAIANKLTQTHKFTLPSFTPASELNKADDTLSNNVKFVANTYLWLDSHEDVHDKGVFAETIADGHGIFHLHDHKFEIAAKIGQVKSVKEVAMTWKALGVDIEGETEALIVESDTTKAVNTGIAKMYKTGEITQHSVSMSYKRIGLAINDEDEVEEKALWDANINRIGNKAKALDKGYFWLIKEATLREVSAVLAGSNEVTPTLEVKSNKTEVEIETIKEFNEGVKAVAAIKTMLADWNK